MKTTLTITFVMLALLGCDDASKQRAATITGGGDPDRGESAIHSYGCASCHTIPGIRGADGQVGPPLDRIGSRGYIAGIIENTPPNMMRWLKNPPGVDPMTAMPNLHLQDSDVRDIASYLYTLQ